MSEPMSTAGAGHGDVCYKAGQALFSLTLSFFSVHIQHQEQTKISIFVKGIY